MGRDGDQKAGDGVWSYAATFAPAKTISYIYTNSGTPGRWEGLDVPHIRRVEVPSSPDGRPVYMPIETFGRIYMQGDDWHTDAVGYDAIGTRWRAQSRDPLAPASRSAALPSSTRSSRVAQARANSSSCVAMTSVRPSAIEPAQQLAELRAPRGIERRGRLVHQQHRRIDGERARDRHALRLAARQLPRQRRRAVLDAESRAAARARAARRRAGATPYACTGARQTFSSADRCSNRQ